jgi:hypothetical protein
MSSNNGKAKGMNDRQVKANLKEAGHLIAIAQLDGAEFDLDLEPHVLTDKSSLKALPCRTCKRPCIVTQFASAAKTACNDHRDRHAPVTTVTEIRTDKEAHVLTDKEETKTVPCRHCGRPCVVTLFASAAKVACLDCRKSAPRPKKTTEYATKKRDERQESTTVMIMSEHDLQWSKFVLDAPFDIVRQYEGDEKDEHNAAIQEGIEAAAMAKNHARTRRMLEESLRLLPNIDRVSADRAEKIGKEAKELETQIETLDADEVAETAIAKDKRDKADAIARVAFIRGALAARYELTLIDGRHALVRGDRTCLIPDKYLDTAGYHQAGAELAMA